MTSSRPAPAACASRPASTPDRCRSGGRSAGVGPGRLGQQHVRALGERVEAGETRCRPCRPGAPPWRCGSCTPRTGAPPWPRAISNGPMWTCPRRAGGTRRRRTGPRARARPRPGCRRRRTGPAPRAARTPAAGSRAGRAAGAGGSGAARSARLKSAQWSGCRWENSSASSANGSRTACSSASVPLPSSTPSRKPSASSEVAGRAARRARRAAGTTEHGQQHADSSRTSLGATAAPEFRAEESPASLANGSAGPVATSSCRPRRPAGQQVPLGQHPDDVLGRLLGAGHERHVRAHHDLQHAGEQRVVRAAEHDACRRRPAAAAPGSPARGRAPAGRR